MMEIQDCIELLRPEPQMMGAQIANVCLPAEYASNIADLLEGLAAKLEHDREWIQRLEKGLRDEKKVASDLREENKILWGALNMATGRVRELWEGAK